MPSPGAGVRRLAWGALAAVVAQGVLGGLTVIFLLPTPVSVTHACLAQTFFCLVIALAYATSREWLSASPVADSFGMRGAATLATAIVFLQLFLGAVMRHTGAGLAIPDFPLAFGRLVPPFAEPAVVIHFAHRVGALLVAVVDPQPFLACVALTRPALRAPGGAGAGLDPRPDQPGRRDRPDPEGGHAHHGPRGHRGRGPGDLLLPRAARAPPHGRARAIRADASALRDRAATA